MTDSKLRILVIDDNKEIHEDFRKVFAHAAGVHDDDLQDIQADFFQDAAPAAPRAAPLRDVEIDSAFQGHDGVAMALQAAREGRAHAMAFVDVRMPPGIDGVQAIKRIWEDLPELNCVLCTAFSDYDWEDIRQQLPHSSNLLILKKPFDPVEVLQIVESLAEKVELAQESRRFQHRLEGQIEELQRAHQELQRLNEQLQAARADAETAARAKADFLASMSHELRTPLNGVIAMTDMLLYTSLDAQQEKYVRTAKSSGESLLELINDILDFSRIESGKFELESTEFALHRELEAVITVVARSCQAKHLELACFVDPALLRPLQGDPRRMRQILTNLATNAVKFTERGEVVIEIVVQREDESKVWVEFQVSDTGIGIPPDRQHRLFHSFSQVDASTTRKYGGTGLGLAISKQLCELMGGEIGFRSAVGQGSVFRFILPFEKRGDGNAKKQALPPSFRGKRLLLVDDNRRVCDILDRQLNAWGLQVETARNLSGASSLLEEAKNHGQPFAAVLLDTGIGGAQAEDLAQTLRSFPQFRDTPLILLIPLGQPGKLSDLLGKGVAGFVNKPIVPSDLFNVLMRLTANSLDPGTLPTCHVPRDRQLLPVPKTRHTEARILLAEDNVINQKVATQILKCFGYAFDIVADGKQAVQSLCERPYDLVLMDCQMPEMDGLEATRAIRDLEARGSG